MKSLLKQYAIILTISSLVSAQAIVPQRASGSFPQCATSCAVLLQAQTQCEPPTAAQASEITYENCFCQEPILTGLYSTANAVCTAECPSASDLTLLQTWFLKFCQQVGQGIDPLVTDTSSTLQVVTVTSTSTGTASTSSATAVVTGSGPSQEAASPSNKSW